MENPIKNILELRKEVLDAISKKLKEVKDLLPKKGEKFTRQIQKETEEKLNELRSIADASRPILDAFKPSEKYLQYLKQAKIDFGLPEDFEEYSILNRYEETKVMYKESYEVHSFPEERILYLDQHINKFKAVIVERKRQLKETIREKEVLPVKRSKFEIEEFNKRIAIKTENLEALIGKLECFVEYLEILKRDAITPKEFTIIEEEDFSANKGENENNQNPGDLEKDKKESFESLFKDKNYFPEVMKILKDRTILIDNQWMWKNDEFFAFIRALIINKHIKYRIGDAAKYYKIFNKEFQIKRSDRTFQKYLNDDNDHSLPELPWFLNLFPLKQK